MPTSGSTNAVSSGSVFTALSFKADLVGGKVPAIQLPSYVDDVLEGYYNGTSFFIDSTFSTIMTPETGKIYINLLNNTSYRYTGSVYVQISNTVSSLNDLTDVTIGTLNNGQILQYNGTTSQWENVSVTIGSGDMQKSVYDIDNDGVVDYSETISVTVRNNSSTDTLRRGTIVYLSGSTGNRPNAFKAQANSESTSSGTFGVVVNDIGPNSDGLVAAMGTLHNLDTRTGANGNPNPFTSDTLLDGDILWLDPTTAGYVTKTKPSAPDHAVFIGIVAATSPTNGRIVYKIQNGYEIDELHNVKITSPLLNNQVLRYTQSTGLWENKTLNFQTPLTLTTNGTSGAATLAGDGVLNIPNYSTAPGGSNTEVQFNNSGVFGGSSKFTWSNDILSLNTLTSPVSPILQISSYFSASGNDGKVGTRIYNVGQDLAPNRSMTTLNFDVASEPMTNWQTAMSLISEFDINDNLQNVTLSVNGGLSLANIPLITTDATNILGVNTSGGLGKLSLDSSTLSLSSAGVLSGVIKTLNDLTDVVVSSPTSGQVLSYNGTNWVNTTGGGGGTPAGNTGEIQFNNAGAFAADSNLYWDNTNKNLGIGTNSVTNSKVEIKLDSASENVRLLSGNLATTASGTNWTGTDFATGYTHTTGSTAVLTATGLTISANTFYEVTYTITGRTAGSVNIGIGGQSSGTVTESGQFFKKTTSATTLTVTPTSDFNGTIAIVVKSLVFFGTLGPNILTTATGTGWSGTSFATGYTRTSGTAALVAQNVVFENAYYYVEWTVSNYTSGTFFNNIGSHPTYGISTSGAGYYGPCLSGGTFQIVPTSGNLFLGTVQMTARKIIPIKSFMSLEDSTGAVQIEVRNNQDNRNLAIGFEAGQNLANGTNNVFIGHKAGKYAYNTTNSILIGKFEDSIIKSDQAAPTNAGNNIIIGTGMYPFPGNNNVIIGTNGTVGTQTSNLQNSIIIGSYVAPNISDGSANIILGGGSDVPGSCTNRIVIGVTNSLGSNNTTVIGTSATTQTHLYGTLTLGSTTTDATAQLVVNSTTKGFLPPRMTTANRTAISATPTAGLVIYNSDVNRLQVYNGTTWVDESKYALNRQTASYTLVLSDTGKLVETNVATANTVTVPLNSAQAFEVGARVDIIQYGAGQTTITPTAGVTIRSANGWTKINAQYGAVSLVKIGTDEWYLFGNLNA